SVYDPVCNVQDFGCCLGIASRGMLVQEQVLRLFQRGHQKGERLCVIAVKKANLGGQTDFQSHVKILQELSVFFSFFQCDSRAETAVFTPAFRQCNIFFVLHCGCGSSHGILEHTAKISASLVLGKFCHVDSVDEDLSLFYQPGTRHCVQHGGLARAVAADDSDEIAFLQSEGKTVQGKLLVNGSRMKGPVYVLDLKHWYFLPV